MKIYKCVVGKRKFSNIMLVVCALFALSACYQIYQFGCPVEVKDSKIERIDSIAGGWPADVKAVGKVKGERLP